MKSLLFASRYKTAFMVVLFAFTSCFYGQQKPFLLAKDDFWKHVHFGGSFSFGISNEYTNIVIAPSAIYAFDDTFALGAGLQYSNLKQRNLFSSNVYGTSLIGLLNPVPEIQLSLEVEEINVNNKYPQPFGSYSQDSFWNTNLFLGGGYRNGNITVGMRYNLLFDKNKDIYGDAFMPFVRVYF